MSNTINWVETPVLTGEKMLVQPMNPMKKTDKGIIIPDTVENLANTGIIVAVSDEIQSFDKSGNPVYIIGTKVQFHPNTGYAVVVKATEEEKPVDKNLLLLEVSEIQFLLK